MLNLDFPLFLRPTEIKTAYRKNSVITNAEMAELVDALDSKSCTLGCVGSIPTFGTKLKGLNFTVEAFFVRPIYKVPIQLSFKIIIRCPQKQLKNKPAN